LEDPHRAAGCALEGRIDPAKVVVRDLRWFELLDWAVYHAPGWESWQEFRRGLVGQPMAERCTHIRTYWEVANALHVVSPDPDRACADAVRVINLLRSLRGQMTEYPELRQFLKEINPLLEQWWGPRKG